MYKGQKFLCMCSRTQENDKNEVKTDFWDTLYDISRYLDIYSSSIHSYNLYSIIRQLVDKEVVMAAAAFAISHERMQAVNFTSPIDLQPYAFMYRRPKEVP